MSLESVLLLVLAWLVDQVESVDLVPAFAVGVLLLCQWCHFDVSSGWLCGLLIRFFNFVVWLGVECAGSKHLGPFVCVKVRHVFDICCNCQKPIVKHNVPLCRDVTGLKVQNQRHTSSATHTPHLNLSPIWMQRFHPTSISVEHTLDN